MYHTLAIYAETPKMHYHVTRAVHYNDVTRLCNVEINPEGRSCNVVWTLELEQY